MWSKVNGWLSDIDNKLPKTSVNTDEKPQFEKNNSLLSKDMFDERFEDTKEELFSQNIDYKGELPSLEYTFDKEIKRAMREPIED